MGSTRRCCAPFTEIPAGCAAPHGCGPHRRIDRAGFSLFQVSQKTASKGGRILVQRKMIAVCAAAMAAWMLTSPVQAQDAVKVGVTRLNTAGPAFIGKEKGFFKKHGIDLEVKIFGAASDIPV